VNPSAWNISPDGSLRVVPTIGGLEELKCWIMRFGSREWVLEPQEPGKWIIGEFSRGLASYRRPESG